jgi:hypothetical protein
MVSFLNEGILIALLAVTIPLLLHLMNRQNRLKIKFSSIRFLKTIEDKRIKKIKIYQILLIVLRSLIILFLVLSFARPTVTSKTAFNRYSAGSTAVIILDNGINMQAYDKAGSRFNRAKDKLISLRSAFNTTDNVVVFSAHEPENTLTDSVQIAAVSCSYGRVDWQQCLEMARQHFQNHPNYNQDLFIISDFQFHYPAFESALAKLESIRIHLLNIFNQRINNISIDSLLIKNKIFEVGKPLNIDVMVHNSSPYQNDNIELHLFINGQRHAYQKFNLQAAEIKTIALSCQLKGDSQLVGYVELNDDDLPADNRYYFSLNLPDSIHVLYVDDSISSHFDAALNALELNTNIRITREKYVSWAGKRFDHFQIIFLSNLATVPAVLLNRLKSFLDQGGSLILMPGDRTDIPEFNRICHELNFNFTLSEIKTVSQNGEYYSLRASDWNQPIFSDMFRKSATDLSNPIFTKYFKIRPGTSNEILLSFNTGDPFILNSPSNKRSVFLICSYIDDPWTDFQYKGTFLPLLLRMLLLAATNADYLNQSLVIDQPMFLRIKVPENAQELSITSSAGEKTKIINPLNNSRIVLDNHILSLPGNYTLYCDNQELSTISVNADTRSLIPPYINLDILHRDIPNLNILNENDDLIQSVTEQRAGIELFNLLILLVLVTLLAETGLIKLIEGGKIS